LLSQNIKMRGFEGELIPVHWLKEKGVI